MDIKKYIKTYTPISYMGGSFIFMRVISPELGPILTASMRTLIAGVFLLIVFRFIGYRIQWKRDFIHLLVIGVVNSSVPFFMYAYAALHIDASLSSILNSLSPMFGAIFSALFLIEPLNIRKGSGLILGGTIGVAIVTSVNVSGMGTEYFLSIGACIVAALCYGLSSVYIKLRASHIKPKAIAAGSQLLAGLALLALAFLYPVSITVTPNLVATVVIFAVICSAIAYLLYYDLINSIGPTKALTVTYLIPITAILWGGLILLGESISFKTVLGGFIILLGTYLIHSRGQKQTSKISSLALNDK